MKYLWILLIASLALAGCGGMSAKEAAEADASIKASIVDSRTSGFVYYDVMFEAYCADIAKGHARKVTPAMRAAVRRLVRYSELHPDDVISRVGVHKETVSEHLLRSAQLIRCESPMAARLLVAASNALAAQKSPQP